MGDFGVDDWASLVDKDVQEIKAAVGPFDIPAKQQQFVPEIVQAIDQKQTKKQSQPSKKKKDEGLGLGVVSVQDDKPKPISNDEKRKAELFARIANQGLVDDLFSDLGQENKKASTVQIILKSDKDFVQYAKTVASKFDQDTTPSDFLQDFCIQLLVNIYPLMTSPQLREIQDKMAILKNEKKKEEKKKKKQVKKQGKKEEAQAVVGEREKSQQEKDPRYVPGMDDFM